MVRRKLIQFTLLSCVIISSNTQAFNWNGKPVHPFYLGVTGGYGETTWGQLVPDENNAALNTSTPINASEGGVVWGVYGGYEFLRAFALEGSYMRYPTARIEFDPFSVFSIFNNGRTEFNSKTESISIVAKVMLPLGCSKFRLYSAFGAAGVHRDDVAANVWRISPQFGAGFNYDLTEQVMFEAGTEYVAGYGQSELDPAKHYVPFLYSGFFRIAYRF